MKQCGNTAKLKRRGGGKGGIFVFLEQTASQLKRCANYETRSDAAGI